MAKTIAELASVADVLSTRLDSTRQDVKELLVAIKDVTTRLQAAHEELARSREENGHFRRQMEQLQTTVLRLEQAHVATREQLAAATARFEEFRKHFDESDRRRFTLIGLIVGAELSLAANVAVNWLKK